jgi:hypothetical protein
VQVLVDTARADGSLHADLDVDAVLYFVRVLRLGRLVMRASGLTAPDQGSWESLVRRVLASLGADYGGPVAPAPTPTDDGAQP